jgi:glycerophosphoryl diester phosphodiesterase
MIVIGHRGARGLAPENTLLGIQKVLEHHVDMVEVDLRVTKDGVAVLSHNKTVKDDAGNTLGIHDHTYDELKAHKHDLATFEELLQTTSNEVRFLIEVKGGERVEPVVSVLRKHLAHGHNPGQFLLGSKSQKTLLALHKSLPDIETIIIEPWSGVRASWRARNLKTKFIAMRSWWLWPGFISAMRNSDYQLVAYTMNNPAKSKKWGKYGLYGVITDYPDRFKKS